MGQSISGTIIDETIDADLDLTTYYVSLIDEKGDIYMTVQANSDGTFLFEDVMYTTYNLIIHQNPNGEKVNNIESIYDLSSTVNATLTPITVTSTSEHTNLDIAITETPPLSHNHVDIDGWVNGESIEIIWNTKIQKDINSFIIEKSATGNNWNPISESISVINEEYHDYKFEDMNPFVGYNYYRVKIVNNNATNSYSLVKKVLYNKTDKVIIYPVPTQDELNIKGINSGDMIKLYDISGQLIYTSIALSDRHTINTSSLTSGLYFINIIQNNHIVKYKFNKI